MELYKKVSIVDEQANLAAAAAAAASLGMPVGLSSILPLAAALPVLPLKFLPTPALFAQAMEKATKAATAASSAVPTSNKVKEEIPLDLTVKPDSTSSVSTKRRADSGDDAPGSAKKAMSSAPTSPVPKQKIAKMERQIYRCQACSIPFYKKDVYEAHRLHYCAGRSVEGSERSDSPQENCSDERLVITYTCNKCSTSYRTIDTFKAHQCSVTPLPTLRCDECDYSTNCRKSLAEHAETHTKVNVTFKCKLCGYHGNTMRGMKQHGRQHQMSGEEFSDSDVSLIEVPTPVPRLSMPALTFKAETVEEELLRLKNEPYKKRRSRKHYQKTEYTTHISPQISPTAVAPIRQSSYSPQSTTSANSAHSRTSPRIEVKEEPIDVLEPTSPHRKSPVRTSAEKPPRKAHTCSCQASFAYLATYEAHKKHYCPNNKSSPTPVVSSPVATR